MRILAFLANPNPNISDQFLGYSLYLPLVNEYHTHLDFSALTMTIPKYLWLTDFVLITDH